MTTPQQFLTDLEKDLVKADPMERHGIVLGYAKHLEAREDALTQSAYDLLYWKYKEVNGQNVSITFLEAYNTLTQELHTTVGETQL